MALSDLSTSLIPLILPQPQHLFLKHAKGLCLAFFSLECASANNLQCLTLSLFADLSRCVLSPILTDITNSLLYTALLDLFFSPTTDCHLICYMAELPQTVSLIKECTFNSQSQLSFKLHPGPGAYYITWFLL